MCKICLEYPLRRVVLYQPAGKADTTNMMPGRALPPVPCGEVDFLLPTGMMVTVNATPSTTLRQLKDRLYQEAKQHPLFSMLKDQGFYNFLGT